MEERIKALEDRVTSLTKSLLQLQKNQTPITEKAESADMGVDDLSLKHEKNAANIDYMAMEMDIDLEV